MVEVIMGALKKEQEERVVDIESDDEEAEEKAVKRRRRRKPGDPQKKRACVDCTKRCDRIHGRASSLPSSSKARPIPAVPSFFKVMMGYFSENMEIPTPFAKTILDLAGSNIYLEDAYGLRWRVRLCLRDGVLSFGHGWKNFALDHAVSCGEFLVFRQIARSVFTVQMFAPSAVERLYLCEKNKRQSRKRKPRQKSSCPSSQTVTTRKKNVGTCKKKRRTDCYNDPIPKDSNISVHICVDSEVELLDGVTDAGNECMAEPPISDATGSKQPESMGVIDVSCNTNHMTDLAANAHRPGAYRDLSCLAASNVMTDDKVSAYAQDGPVQLHCIPRLENESTEIDNGDGSKFAENVDASGPLAMMDLNEVSIDDSIFLSADTYEFETDCCNPEGFSVDLNMEGLTNGQASGFNCIENTSQNNDSSMGLGQRFVMSETLSCIENKQMVDPPETCTDAVNVTANDIDINALPANEPLPFARDNSCPSTEVTAPSSECATNIINEDECNTSFPCKGNQAAQKEDSRSNHKASEFVPEHPSVKQDQQQDGQVSMHDCPEQSAAEIMSRSSMPQDLPHVGKNQTGNSSGGLQSGSSESGGVLALAANGGKFCVAIPPPGQTWLELPCRLPTLPRTKRQGRKVVILKDPCMRLWPVLYQCTPRFNGFITGWLDVSRENNLREGDACEFELSGNSELSFQVRPPIEQ
ncbi:hypothetical protein ACP4OV_029826 [Aristida adscensionis]